MIDLDALEALEKKAFGPRATIADKNAHDASMQGALPELIRLARIGQRVERDAKHPDPLSQALNEGDGVYRP